jgi:hypothetical protein
MKFRTAKKIWNRANRSSWKYSNRRGLKYYFTMSWDWDFWLANVPPKMQTQVREYYHKRGLHNKTHKEWVWPEE